MFQMIAKLEFYFNKLRNVILIWVRQNVYHFWILFHKLNDQVFYLLFLKIAQGSAFIIGTFGIKLFTAKLLRIEDDVSLMLWT